MASSPKFNFPFETLTPISGKPTNTTLQLLQRPPVVYKRSFRPIRPRGRRLAVLLSEADYVARVGVAFELPIHPGPPAAAVGTATGVAVAICVYTEQLADVMLYNNLRAALTAQILTAVNASFLSALEDPDFGFGDVTPFAMLEHLRTEYGTDPRRIGTQSLGTL